MKSPWIDGLRSVALHVPDLGLARDFYTKTWRLRFAEQTANALYLSGSGADHHVLALHRAPGAPSIMHVTLRARSLAALASVASAAVGAGGTVLRAISATPDPAGGQHILVQDPHGRRFEVVHGDSLRSADNPAPDDQPLRLAHAVLNSHSVEAAQAFLQQAFGFVLADRTRIMAFMNCNDDHHSLAIGDTDNDALNHIAFLMPSLDAVMRGGGRMRDAGHPIEWGPGRHGPGDNAFNYFIDPFGIVIEYTAEVEQIDETYCPAGPADWKWPDGRTDQWGISGPPSARLKEAQRGIHFDSQL